MRFFIIFTIIVSFISCGGNPNKNMDITPDMIDSDNPPVMEFESTEFDFGEITEGEVVLHEFKFTNTGKSNLILGTVAPSCGCTVPKDWPKEPIPPGESGVIKAEFNSDGQSGAILKFITITANTIPSQSKIVLRGKVVGPGSE